MYGSYQNCLIFCLTIFLFTPGRRQSKSLLTIDERGSKIARNSVFDCHLSPVRQMAIENSFSNDFDLRSSIVLTFSIAAYPVCYLRDSKPSTVVFVILVTC